MWLGKKNRIAWAFHFKGSYFEPNKPNYDQWDFQQQFSENIFIILEKYLCDYNVDDFIIYPSSHMYHVMNYRNFQ